MKRGAIVFDVVFTCFVLIKSVRLSVGDNIPVSSSNHKIIISNTMAIGCPYMSVRDICGSRCNNTSIGKIICMVYHWSFRKWWLHHVPQIRPCNFKILLPIYIRTAKVTTQKKSQFLHILLQLQEKQDKPRYSMQLQCWVDLCLDVLGKKWIGILKEQKLVISVRKRENKAYGSMRVTAALNCKDLARREPAMPPPTTTTLLVSPPDSMFFLSWIIKYFVSCFGSDCRWKFAWVGAEFKALPGSF